jgi:opacity protein-like surface antigen
MKKFGISLLSFLLILSFSFNAMAEVKPSNTGFYVAILGGISMPMDMKTTFTDNDDTPPTISNQDISLKTGWLAGAKIGYLTPFTKRILAVEFEYNHIANDFDTGKIYNVAGTSLTLDGSIKIDAFMLNLIGRYPEGRFHPYIGAGAGYANVQIDTIQSSPVGAFNNTSGSKGVFAYQILAGVDFDITNNWFVGLGYKYFAANKVSYDVLTISPDDPGETHPGSVDAEYKSSIITLSVGYLF